MACRYYLRNVISFLFVFSLLAPLVFLMNIRDTGVRITNVLTILLITVAFKFTIGSVLPRVTYNTLLDHYITSSNVRLCVSPHDSCQVYVENCVDVGRF